MDEKKSEQIGMHKGALMTLAKEREALMQLLSVVQQLMAVHAKALKELGVDIEAEAKEAMEKLKKEKNKSDIEERLK